MTTSNKTETYVLQKGKHSGFDEDGNAKVFKAGDKITLTEDQAKAFKGKFKSLKQLKAEAKFAEEGFGVDPETDASPAMTPSREQPLAPNAPVDPETGKLEDESQQLAEEINADLAGDAPAAGTSDTDSKEPAKETKTAEPAKTAAPAATPVKPVTPAK